MSDMAIDLKPRKIRVSEYRHMAEVGIFAPDERVELLDGAIVEMSPLGASHILLHSRIVQHLVQRLANRASIFGMVSVTFGEFSEPQPDIVIADPRCITSYKRPEQDDVFALIEIADSSLRADMGFKRDLYAMFEIKDYLVVDVKGSCLHRFVSPHQGAYAELQHLSHNDSFALVAIPDVELDVKAFLPPRV